MKTPVKVRNFCVPILLMCAAVPSFLRADNFDFDATTDMVGRRAGGIVTPVNQITTPAGTQVELPGMRPQALALSPSGKLLVTAGLTHELVVLNPATGEIVQRVQLPSDQVAEPSPVTSEIMNPDTKAQLSFTGLVFSPDGSRVYMANVNGDIKVFSVGRITRWRRCFPSHCRWRMCWDGPMRFRRASRFRGMEKGCMWR